MQRTGLKINACSKLLLKQLGGKRYVRVVRKPLETTGKVVTPTKKQTQQTNAMLGMSELLFSGFRWILLTSCCRLWWLKLYSSLNCRTLPLRSRFVTHQLSTVWGGASYRPVGSWWLHFPRCTHCPQCHWWLWLWTGRMWRASALGMEAQGSTSILMMNYSSTSYTF